MIAPYFLINLQAKLCHSSHLSLLHDILDLLIFRLQVLVRLGHVGEPPLVLVVPENALIHFGCT